MSAFDMAGAVVWSPVAIFLWATVAHALLAKGETTRDEGGAIIVLVLLAIVASLGAVYCIARLNGLRA